MVMNEIDFYNECGSGGLEIIKFLQKFEHFDGKNDKLTVLCDITVHMCIVLMQKVFLSQKCHVLPVTVSSKLVSILCTCTVVS